MSDGEAGYKYGALVFAPPEGPPESKEMYGGKETFEGDLLSLVPEAEHAHWREWIGSVAWDNIRRAGRVVISRISSSRADVLDAEDHQLRNQMRNAWAAFVLTGTSHSDRPAWVISGRAMGASPGARLGTIRSAQPQDRIVRPFYETRPRYIEFQAARIGRHWAAHGTHDQSWFPLWTEIDELFARRTPRPPILGYALLAYSSAWTRSLLEFSIPEFVRAAEGIIALPPRTGRALFRDRALALVPSLRTDEYVGADVDGLLLKLYDLRSDCVHGKVPFHDMQSRGEAGEEEAAQLGYVAEVLARDTMLLALRRPDWTVFADRDRLQRAWDGGAFP
jgi:hypothetical protein